MLFSIILSILLNINLFANGNELFNESERSNVDSLIYYGNFERVEQIFNEKDALLLNNNFTKNHIQKYMLYKLPGILIIEQYKNLLNQNSQYVARQINYWKKLDGRFSEDNTNKTISKLFQKFKNSASTGYDITIIIKNYLIANYFYMQNKFKYQNLNKEINKKYIHTLISQIIESRKVRSKNKNVETLENKNLQKLIIKSDVENALLYIDGILKGEIEYATNLPSGNYQIIVYKENYLPYIIDISLKNENYQSSNPLIVESVLAESSLLLTCVPNDINIFIDGKNYTGINNQIISIASGYKKFDFSKFGYEKENKSIKIIPFKINKVNIELNKIKKYKLIKLSTLFPGLGQYYAGKKFLGLTYATSVVAVLLGANLYNQDIKNLKNDYKTYKFWFYHSYTDQEKNLAKNKLNRIYDKLKTAESTRNTLLISAACVWLWNIIDSYILEVQIKNINNNKAISLNVYF